MKHYWKYIKPYKLFFIFGPLLMLTEVLGEIVLPKLMSGMINEGIPNGDTGYIIARAGLMAGFICLMIIGGVGGHYLSIKASVYFSADLRRDLFKKVQEFSFKNIDDFSTGSLVTRLTNDITQMQNLIRMCLIMAMRSPGMLVGGLIMALSINVDIAKVLFYVIPCLAIAIGALLRLGFPKFGLMQKKLDALNSSIQENITNVRVVKSFVREEHEIEKFRKSNTDLMDTTLSALRIVVFTMPVMTLAMNITTLLVVWNGGNLVIGGGMKVGDLTAFTTYIVQILMSLMMLSMIIMQLSRAMASSRRITEVLDTEVDLTDDNAAKKDAVIEHGSVEFKNVCFRYYENRKENVLDNISFKINPGETVGIIGTTGSGKTTLVQLIPRLYDATSGEVLVDGVNVKDYSLEHLRTAVGMVLQKNVLFSGTIVDNLKWGDENATDKEIEAAAESAQADSFVKSFTDGYDTELGQGGVNVSGGQKQRLCIARALLKKPKILILDDSTSAVDTATEAKIREAFRTSLKDSTKIIISQRINSVMEADKIIVLDDGRIAGMGTHGELLKTSESYREIYSSQTDMKEVS
ncbi:MAG TPA: ABC transporter ATP-binding protein [Candidatus Ornithomonoglobus intestinigallinarum]|uniref:ABC transporter ATP-binding protein n=1 Tax=Candidatus Ornithomonoglobus intestinigallinarum TaxID=2840894 RepID=A0A9D1KRB6_9FIRM|nr:ABC transporter ATP-binding protein [Candidatus Ornithomonoglobus intestinigallinarum]